MVRSAQASEPERRLSLLKAAFREVAEKGFSEVTLDDIARRAGVSKGVTLYYFDSKEALFRELWATLGGEFAHFRRFSTAPPAAVNREYASPDTILRDGDEVAFLPPVAGG